MTVSRTLVPAAANVFFAGSIMGMTKGFCCARIDTVFHPRESIACAMAGPQSVALAWKRQTRPFVSPSVMALAAPETIMQVLALTSTGLIAIAIGLPQMPITATHLLTSSTFLVAARPAVGLDSSSSKNNLNL